MSDFDLSKASVSEIRSQPVVTFDLDAIKPTLAISKAIELLDKDRELCILHSCRSNWGASMPPDYSGTWIARWNMDLDEPLLVQKIHGSSLSSLYASGMVALDRAAPTPNRRVSVFRLSGDARANFNSAYRKLVLSRWKTCSTRLMNSIAARYGMKPSIHRFRGLVWVEWLDGTSVNPNGETMYLHTDKSGNVIRSVTSLNPAQWDALFEELRDWSLSESEQASK